MRHAATRLVAPRRDHRRLGVVHLRPRLGRGLPRARGAACRWARSSREAICRRLVEIQYQRNDSDFEPRHFRVRGDTIEVQPPTRRPRSASSVRRRGREHHRVRPAHRRGLRRPAAPRDLPGDHYVTPPATIAAPSEIRAELDEQARELRGGGKLVEAQRLRQRTDVRHRDAARDGLLLGDRELLAHLDGRRPGEPPRRSSTTSPTTSSASSTSRTDRSRRSRGMYRRPLAQGDPDRRRLPAAVGARQPAAAVPRVRAARQPGHLRLGDAGRVRAAEGRGVVVEQIIRPTGLVDPEVEVRPPHQVDDLLERDPGPGRPRRAGAW